MLLTSLKMINTFTKEQGSAKLLKTQIIFFFTILRRVHILSVYVARGVIEDYWHPVLKPIHATLIWV